MPLPPENRVLFHRRLIGPTAGTNGGNLKLRDCFEHFQSSANWQPAVYFSPETSWNDHPGNHWSDLRDQGLAEWNPRPGDLLFFSGGDWRILDRKTRQKSPVPILNIVQPRHVRPQDPRHEFLHYPAIRIAKSRHGAKILRDFGVNGPLEVIPDSIDLAALPALPAEKDIDLLVIGLKEPELANQLYERLSTGGLPADEKATDPRKSVPFKIHIQLPPKLPTRMDFLRLLARARTVCCLPLRADRGGEGFYLPALEAMALQTLVVCPPAVGNRDHCLDGVNCLVPEYNLEGLLTASLKALRLPAQERRKLIAGGLRTARTHRIENERRALLELADRAYDLWAQEDLFVPSPRFNLVSRWGQKMKRIFR